jgi:hypothetical protein
LESRDATTRAAMTYWWGRRGGGGRINKWTDKDAGGGGACLPCLLCSSFHDWTGDERATLVLSPHKPFPTV